MLTTNALFVASFVAATSAACVGNVGGAGSGRGHGSDDPTPETCDKVEEVTTAVTIRSNADFDKVPDGCWDLYAPLTIEGSEITSLAKLGNLQGANELHLSGTSLKALDTLKPLKVYGALSITNNDQLTDLKNLSLEWVDNVPLSITIDDNAVLATLDGVADVTRADGNIAITSNPKLASAALHKLDRVDGSIKVTDNAALTTLDLSALTTVAGIEVSRNQTLTTLSGLGATAIHGSMIVRANPALTTMGSMSSLSRIEGDLIVDDNDALTNISAFTASMQYVTGALSITNNQALGDLGQISHLTGIGTITITNNVNLSFCRAQEVDHCVPTHGTVLINNNKSASNCNCWCGR